MMSDAAILAEAPSLWMALWTALQSLLPYNTRTVLLGTLPLGVACGVIGCFLILRRRALVADALGHATLPGVCLGYFIAIWLGLNERSLLILLPAAGAMGLLGVATLHLLSRVPRVRDDAAIGVVLSVYFAMGIVLLSVIQSQPTGSPAGLSRFIFGQAAGMDTTDALLIGVLAFVSLILAAIFLKEMRLLCFDPAYARSIGWRTSLLDGALLVMTTVVTLAGLHAVGAVLIVALLVIPPAAARFWTDRLGVMLTIAASLGGVSAVGGTLISGAMHDWPTGPAIVIVAGVGFIISMFIAPNRGLLARSHRRRTFAQLIARQHLLRAMYEAAELRGNMRAPIPRADLHHRRDWTPRRLQRAIHRAIRRGEIVAAHDGYELTERGLRRATQIVRSHRLWEHYLATRRGVDTAHIDRPADDIEHALGEAMVDRLEAALIDRGVLHEPGAMPESLHTLEHDAAPPSTESSEDGR